MIDNFSEYIQAAAERPIRTTCIAEQDAAEAQRRSAIANSKTGITIDRPADYLLGLFGVSLPAALTSTAGGVVVDAGCGRSNFLDQFRDVAQTIAIDLSASHVDHQRSRGHQALQSSAENLEGVADNSVDLLLASYSAPFWTVTHREARQAANAVERVLKVGGTALIGPVLSTSHHSNAEHWMLAKQWEVEYDLASWGYSRHRAHQAAIAISYCSQLLVHDNIDITGVRNDFDTMVTAPDQHYHLPNFLLMQKRAIASADSRVPGQA